MSLYHISKLVLTSDNSLPDAILDFTKGLNVIEGPTNTGKSFVFECLNFMLGGKDKPKDILEARNYSTIFLELAEGEKGNNFFTLKRSKNGGDFQLYKSDFKSIHEVKPVTLGEKHDKNKETVSSFFLKLNHLENKTIRTNANGKTRSLSFRDICHLVLVSEENIIKAGSPLLSKSFTNKTTELSLVKLLITGQDDSSIVNSQSKKDIDFRKGKIEMLSELLRNFDDDEINVDNNMINDQLEHINNSITINKAEYDQLLSEFNELSMVKNNISESLFKLNQDWDNRTEIMLRAELLRESYLTDIKRLKATIEAGDLLSENNINNVSTCPLCLSDISCELHDAEVQKIIDSCKFEVNKIFNLLDELNKSMYLMEEENIYAKDEINKSKASLITIEKQLKEGVQLKLKSKIEFIDKLNLEKNSALELSFKKNNYIQLLNLKNEYQKSPKKDAKSKFDSITTSNMQPLCDIIRSILTECNFEGLTTVSFSEEKSDLVISGEDRKLSGKGIRAITYAVFILGLLEYVSKKGYGISIPVFDSPLVTYSKPGVIDAETISHDLAMDFYRVCAKRYLNSQVIILENEVPPEDIKLIINHIKFTGQKGIGRNGFIPEI